MNEYLIKALKDGRMSKGLKQSDVAELVGVKPNTLSNYENGVSEPDIDTFANLCEIYGLDFAFVLGEAYGLGVIGADFDIKPSEINFIKMFRELNEHGKKIVTNTMKEEYKNSLMDAEKDKRIKELESLRFVENDSETRKPDYLILEAAHNDAELTEEEIENMNIDLERLDNL